MNEANRLKKSEETLSSAALLPCPFCGVVPELWSKFRDTGAMDGHRAFVIECVNDKCGVRPQVVRYGPSAMTGQSGWIGGLKSVEIAKQEVKTVWNTRTIFVKDHVRIPITNSLSTEVTDVLGHLDLPEDFAKQLAAQLGTGTRLQLNACVEKRGTKCKLMHVSLTPFEPIETAKLLSVRLALKEYHQALNNRLHGGVAASKFIDACQEILGS